MTFKDKLGILKEPFLKLFNKVFPKRDYILVEGSRKIASNAIAIANQLAISVEKDIYFSLPRKWAAYARPLLHPSIEIINQKSLKYYRIALTSNLVFSTHGGPLEGSSKRQKEVNIWHGLMYKKIRKLRGEKGFKADVTVGTSPLSQKMFSGAFDVPVSSVTTTGYPRNDLMFRAARNKRHLYSKLSVDLSAYDTVLFWLPTYRRTPDTNFSGWYGLKTDNPFQVEGFDSQSFDRLLKQHNALCLIKPHYFQKVENKTRSYGGNILMIDDRWIAEQGITLYDFLGITDILISDYSSVMMDYILLDKPIVCFCPDLEAYNKNQGLYFNDYENWVPSRINKTQGDFMNLIATLLKTKRDPYDKKRKALKSKFFTYHDDQSARRLVDMLFKQTE